MIVANFNHRSAHLKPGLAGLTEEQLTLARAEATKQQVSLYQSVLRLGLASEMEVLTEIQSTLGTRFVSEIDAKHIGDELRERMSAKVASHYTIVPVSLDNGTLTIATSDPFDHALHQELRFVLDHEGPVHFVLAPAEVIRKAIRSVYGIGAATVEQMAPTQGASAATGSTTNLTDESEAREASVMKLVNQLLADAIKDGATDIHIEPYEADLKVRYRIDGVLQDAGIPHSARFLKEAIVSRIKVMSSLDIAEKRLPQDGRTQVDLLNHRFDLRVSILPTRHGEGINIRVLPQSASISDLQALGMTDETARLIRGLIHRPHGIFLVTGPTGSGKTTTLYTCMNQLKNTERKILTIEDPVEYDMPGVQQMQVHAGVGFTFARALRSMLRHDPDIMLVGEIRDLETAETAIRTALTGHLVFSTLHTNDAASTILRLLDMGIEPYLVASSMEAILAQRLVRVICPECREPCDLEEEIHTAIRSLDEAERVTDQTDRKEQKQAGLADLLRSKLVAALERWRPGPQDPVSLAVEPPVPVVYPAFRGKGCSKCRFTGYHGRTVVTELLVLSNTIRSMVTHQAHANEIGQQARKEGMTTLFASGLAKARAGLTTYDEVLRVTKGIF